jgi:hypothetical protein
MKTQKWYVLAALSYVILSYLLFILGAYGGDLTFFVNVTNEGAAVEVIGATGFLLTAILFGAAFFRSRRSDNSDDYGRIKRLFFLLMMVLFLFGAGEELSWGQWVFGFDPPEAVANVNLKHELNLHNLILPGGWVPDNFLLRLFDVFWFGYVVALPAASLYEPARRIIQKYVAVPPLLLGIPFVLAYGTMRLLLAFTDEFRPYHCRIVEVFESDLAVSFVIVAAYILFEQMGTPDRSAAIAQQAANP